MVSENGGVDWLDQPYEITITCNQCGVTFWRGPGPYEPKDGERVACPTCFPPPIGE